MIPKIIHYIWLGGKPKPTLAHICILSWREKNPDYTIVEWNETNLDLDKLTRENRFFAECRKRHMWAHMTDYIRLNILYEIGGIYMDTDMLVLKSLDKFLNDGAFIGKENSQNELSCGIMGFTKGNAFLKSVLEFYREKIWHMNIWTIPSIFTYVFEKSAAVPNLKIYDQEYFYPYPYRADFNMTCLTENSYTIHWWAASWNKAIRPYLFLTTKHKRNPAVRLAMIGRKALGYYVKWGLSKIVPNLVSRGF
jgi:mannosyltransferase OCH1-like enzyme